MGNSIFETAVDEDLKERTVSKASSRHPSINMVQNSYTDLARGRQETSSVLPMALNRNSAVRKSIRKRESFNPRRFSFQRRSARELLLAQEDMTSVGHGGSSNLSDSASSSSRSYQAEVIDKAHIEKLADADADELAHFEFPLWRLEEIYSQLSFLYSSMKGGKRGEDHVSFNVIDLLGRSKGISKWSLERALDKVSSHIENHPLYKSRKSHFWRMWESRNKKVIEEAHLLMSKIIPQDIRKMTVSEIMRQHGYTRLLAQRMVRCRALHLVHYKLPEIGKIHRRDFSIRGRFDFSGLDIIELRAVYKATEGVDRQWREDMRHLLAELTDKEDKGILGKYSKRHSVYESLVIQRLGDRIIKISDSNGTDVSKRKNLVKEAMASQNEDKKTATQGSEASETDLLQRKDHLEVLIGARARRFAEQVKSNKGALTRAKRDSIANRVTRLARGKDREKRGNAPARSGLAELFSELDFPDSLTEGSEDSDDDLEAMDSLLGGNVRKRAVEKVESELGALETLYNSLEKQMGSPEELDEFLDSLLDSR